MVQASRRRLAELTAGAAREALARNPVILLPIGSIEDQGAHAPMGDYLFAERLAEMIAERAADGGTETYVAPVLPFGGDDHFATSPGGMTLSQETLRAVLRDVLGSLVRRGLTRLVVINGHGGNVQAVHDVGKELRSRHGVVVPSIPIWRVAHGLFPGIAGEEVAAEGQGHGAEPLTSVIMHLRPELVEAHRIVPAAARRGRVLGAEVSGWSTIRFEGADIHVPFEYDEAAPDGFWAGHAGHASAETGRALVGRLVEIGAGFVRHYARQIG